MSALETLNEIVEVGGWPRDEEFGVHPYGSKPKRTLICPSDADHPQLIPGHSYLFKQAEGWKAQQMWSEAIAFQIAAVCGVNVPRCFVAFDAHTGEAGALIEFFYGYPGEVRRRRLMHGADLLQGVGLMRGDGRPHGVATNIDFCRSAGIPDAEGWWARTIAFDALIGNTDRHSQNWGFLSDEEGAHIEMAPVFDNGTSLGYQIADRQLAEFATADRIEAFIARGRHNCGWDLADDAPANHIDLCRRLALAYPQAILGMRRSLQTTADHLNGVLSACMRLDIEPRLTQERAGFVLNLILSRRERLIGVL